MWSSFFVTRAAAGSSGTHVKLLSCDDGGLLALAVNHVKFPFCDDGGLLALAVNHVKLLSCDKGGLPGSSGTAVARSSRGSLGRGRHGRSMRLRPQGAHRAADRSFGRGCGLDA